MNKLKLALKSRTAWTVVVMFVLNGVTGVRELVPPTLLPLLDAALGILAIYFRVNRKAD